MNVEVPCPGRILRIEDHTDSRELAAVVLRAQFARIIVKPFVPDTLVAVARKLAPLAPGGPGAAGTR